MEFFSYARYLPRIIEEHWDPRPKTLRLNSIIFGPIPAISSQSGIRPFVYIANYSRNRPKEDVIFFSESNKERVRHYRKEDCVVSIDTLGVELKGTVF